MLFLFANSSGFRTVPQTYNQNVDYHRIELSKQNETVERRSLSAYRKAKDPLLRKKYLVHLALLSILIILSPLQLLASSSLIEIPTMDGLAKLTVEVDKPNCTESSDSAVMLVPGTGLFSRNAYFGKSGTSRDFIFTDLSNKFNAACMTVIRFDSRGVSCDLTDISKIATCIDQSLRKDVTDQTILDDIETVYKFAKSNNLKKLFLVGHSEGSLNISRLVAEKRLSPSGILFIGGVTESAKSIFHWQGVDRFVDLAFELDANEDGVLTNQEIDDGFDQSRLAEIAPKSGILSPIGSWTRNSLSEILESQFQKTRADALSHSDSDEYLSGPVIYSSYSWWKRWFTDDVPVLKNLSAFAGPIKYHNGDIDSQTAGLREKAFLDNYSGSMLSKPIFEIHKNKGHGLGDGLLYGPIDENIANEIVLDIKKWKTETMLIP